MGNGGPAMRTLDTGRAQAFGERLLTTLNDAALCLMLSVGHRTGLFDVMHRLTPATPAEIAGRAGLDERYVREWLGAMTTARVVDVDRSSRHYSLPTEHAAVLTRAAGRDNLAVSAQFIAVLGAVEDDIVTRFREGGGVPYARYGRFHEVMEEDSAQTVVSSLESDILPLVPGLTTCLAGGIRALDAGCGRGQVLLTLGRLYPRSRFLGLDLSEEAIAYARAAAARADRANVEFRTADLSDFHETAEPASFDLIMTFDAIHDQAQPRNVLAGIRRALASDGVYLMQDIKGSGRVVEDIDHPLGTLLYTVSCMHCMPVSLAQGGEGLGAMWGEPTAREYLRAAGFCTVTTHRLAHDVQNTWYVARP